MKKLLLVTLIFSVVFMAYSAPKDVLAKKLTESYAKCETVTIFLGAKPAVYKVVDIETLTIAKDILEIKTKTGWLNKFAVDNLQWISIKTDPKKGTSTMLVIIKGAGTVSGPAKDLGDYLAANYKNYTTVSFLNLQMLPIVLKVADINTLAIADGVLSIDLPNSNQVVYTSISGLVGIDQKTNLKDNTTTIALWF